ncbi:MAG TPA: DUF2270 domain-containing protein [Anaerolineae bacterium]|nr:DUF2270 domain-containing protein [Anaerolineae bacterium]HIQ06794.1 DUF2270 domain-containing protein [Anaerolineae bacterium]
MADESASPHRFTAAELGVLAHLYRAELYRSKIWRVRLDSTTNWAVVTTGLALSLAFSSPQNPPVVIILVSLLVCIFLFIEARRYRYFDIWRYRTRLMETEFFAPLLWPEGRPSHTDWRKVMAQDLAELEFHITMWEAIGRRLRRNYGYIFAVLALSWCIKIVMHPTSVHSSTEFVQRAAVGPIPGWLVISMGVLFNCALVAIGLFTIGWQEASGRVRSRRRPPPHPPVYPAEPTYREPFSEI